MKIRVAIKSSEKSAGFYIEEYEPISYQVLPNGILAIVTTDRSVLINSGEWIWVSEHLPASEPYRYGR